MYGVDVALKKLRPGAIFRLEGSRFTIWEDPQGNEPPTWEEINQQIQEDKKEFEKINPS